MPSSSRRGEKQEDRDPKVLEERMDEESYVEEKNDSPVQKDEVSTRRRDVLKALSSLPVLGAFFYGLAKKRSWDAERKKNLLEELGLEEEWDSGHTRPSLKKPEELLRIGIIGYGGRGEHLVRAVGFRTRIFSRSRSPRIFPRTRITSHIETGGRERSEDF